MRHLLVTSLLLSSVVLIAQSAYTARDCIQACADCVSFYGREYYDARNCIQQCQVTKGRSADDFCANESFHLVKRGHKMNVCKKYCGLCILRWSKDVYDGRKCAISCAQSGGRSVDPNCENVNFSKLQDTVY